MVRKGAASLEIPGGGGVLSLQPLEVDFDYLLHAFGPRKDLLILK